MRAVNIFYSFGGGAAGSAAQGGGGVTIVLGWAVLKAKSFWAHHWFSCSREAP